MEMISIINICAIVCFFVVVFLGKNQPDAIAFLIWFKK